MPCQDISVALQVDPPSGDSEVTLRIDKICNPDNTAEWKLHFQLKLKDANGVLSPGVRITANWMTDRLHNAGSTASNQVSGNATTTQQTLVQLDSALVNNYNQAEINLFYDATSKLMVRGGYRHDWGDAKRLRSSACRSGQRRSRESQTQRRLRRLQISAGTETLADGRSRTGSSGAAYFRTSLYDYQRVRAQARYQAMKALTVTAAFSGLLDHNPTPGVHSDYQALAGVSVILLDSPEDLEPARNLHAIDCPFQPWLFGPGNTAATDIAWSDSLRCACRSLALISLVRASRSTRNSASIRITIFTASPSCGFTLTASTNFRRAWVLSGAQITPIIWTMELSGANARDVLKTG